MLPPIPKNWYPAEQVCPRVCSKEKPELMGCLPDLVPSSSFFVTTPRIKEAFDARWECPYTCANTAKCLEGRKEKAAAWNAMSLHALLYYNVYLWHAHVCPGTQVGMMWWWDDSRSFFHIFLYSLCKSQSAPLCSLWNSTQEVASELSGSAGGMEPFLILTRQTTLKDTKFLPRQIYLLNLKTLFNLSSCCNEFWYNPKQRKSCWEGMGLL